MFTLAHTGSKMPPAPHMELLPAPVITTGTAQQESAGTTAAAKEPATVTAAATTTATPAARTSTAAHPFSVLSSNPAVTYGSQSTASGTQAVPTKAVTNPPVNTPTIVPTATLEPWQPLNTEPPEPLEPGVGDPDDSLPSYPQQPVWDGAIEIQMTAASRFFDSSAVYIHLTSEETGREVYSLRSEQERLHFSVTGVNAKTAVYPGNGWIRQYEHYHMMVYDRRGQVQDFYFCIRPRATVPDKLVFVLEG